MAKLTRYTQKLFGSNASTNEMSEFGSLAAGTPLRFSGSTITPALVQALGNFLTGWKGAVVGSNNPAIEDMNSLCYLFAYQLSYLLQEGVAEWDAGTTYYIGSIVNSSGVLYISKTNNNINHVVTDTTNWTPMIYQSGTSSAPNLVGGATAVPVPASSSADVYVKGNASAWANATLAASTWYDVTWSPELNLFVAVSSTAASSGNIATSPDGVTWTTRTGTTSNGYTQVCWSPYLGLFVVSSQVIGGNAKIITSPDGITWTARTSTDTAIQWAGVCWSQEIGLFVMMGFSGNCQTSPDGITWTARTMPSNQHWTGVCWSKELYMFVAISSVTATVATSRDGINWVNRPNIPSGSWISIAWSAKLNLFVAVGIGPTNFYMTSPDGIIWTASATVPVAIALYKVIWVDNLELFVVAGGNVSGNTNNFSTSPDGINWTTQSVAEDNYWFSVAYAPSLNKFAAVANGLGAGTHYAMNLPSSAISASPAIAAGTIQGQRINVIGTDDQQVVVINPNTGLTNIRQIVLKKNQSARFVWDGVQSKWINA